MHQEMEAMLQHSKRETRRVQTALAMLEEETSLKLTWNNIMLPGSVWNQAISELTGMHNAEDLQALFDWHLYDLSSRCDAGALKR